MVQLEYRVLPTLTTSESLFISVIITIASFLILWAIVSIPVWLSARILRAKQAKFGRAMLVTAAGPIAYWIVFLISTRLLKSLFLLGNNYYYSVASVNIVGIIIAIIVWIYIFKKGFETGWLRALAIAILAVVVFVIVGMIIFPIINQLVPYTPHTTITPIPFHQISHKNFKIF